MKPGRVVNIMSLLLRLSRGRIPPQVDPSVIESQGSTPAGTLFDVYRNRRTTQAVWIAVTGMTVNGGRDPRLIHFARTLAHFGNICIVPTLQGLASCRWEPGDPDELASLVRIAWQMYQQPVGLIGFSFGGSYALLVAGRDGMADRIRRVMTFGTYHDLADMFQAYLKDSEHAPQTDAEWDDAIYQRLAFLYGHRDRAVFPPPVWQAMESLLRRYCWEASSEEKRRFYDRYVSGLDFTDIVRHVLQPDLLQQLSPAGKLSRLTCPVTLIHDQHDHVVPPIHSERLFAELQALPGSHRHRLVLTPLLAHVGASHFFNPADILRFAAAMAPLIPLKKS